ncbi:ABC transporter family protein [Tritrichomonas foetus]|uniref:ABC transporter family protein n=1 Tax=Tritrichomonas foetus TaxID=1144522 RepID=A0A1J4JQY0_9EUKA|nr:ABC transporter family protein [Tritrichomonas foetus]|eukprot:OHT01529.1 ABC transporter family protein [Tritrichomonas foetus]
MEQLLLESGDFQEGNTFFTRRKSLKRSNWNIFLALAKKQIKIRFRSSTSIVEVFFSFFMFLILIPLKRLSTTPFAGTQNPQVFPQVDMPQDLAAFFTILNNTRIVAAPKSLPVVSMMNYIYSNYLRFTSVKIEFTNNAKEIKSMLTEFEANSLGIHWVNSEQNDYLTHPKIDTYTQCITNCPNYTVLRIIRSYIALELMKTDPQNKTLSYLGLMNSSMQQFAECDHYIYHMENHVIMIFISVVVLFSIMPDVDIILIEKDTKTAALCFLMGCSEWLYYLVSFLVSFLCSFPQLLLMSLLYCYIDIMTNVQFSVYFGLCICYCTSYLTFTLFFLTLFKSASSGRILTVIMATLMIAFSFFHEAYLLTIKDPDYPLKHILSIIPQSAYLLVIGSLCRNFVGDYIPIKWNSLSTPLPYKVSTAFFWLIFDTFFYLVLFIISNSILPRKYGKPRFNLRKIFSKRFHFSRKPEFTDLELKDLEGKNLATIPHEKNLYHQDSYFDKIQNEDKFINNFENNSTQNNEMDNVMKDNDRNDLNENNFIIRVNELTKYFDSIQALKNLHFSINHKDLVVVTGPNGAGKSTLINTLSGIIENTTGTIQFHLRNSQTTSAKPSTDFSILQPYIGVVFQENVFINQLSTKENLMLFGTFRGLTKNDIDEFINFFADSLQMKASLDVLAKKLSGGQKRKLCIMIALISNPPIVLMDEPTSGVDIQARQHIWKTISSLPETTSIITSHALEEAETVATKIMIVDEGTIPFTGTATELRSRFKCGYIMRFQSGSKSAQTALSIAQKYMAKAHINQEHRDSILMPVCQEVSMFLTELDTVNHELNIGEYSLNVEHLEDVIFQKESQLFVE